VNASLGATSLATIMQMVACGYSVTLMSEVAIDVELRDDRVKLLRFCRTTAKPHCGAGLATNLAARHRTTGSALCTRRRMRGR
jgi:hypothetical protein